MTTLKFDLRSSGQTVTVAPGDRLEVQLEENPTTGFRWYIDGDENGVLILENDVFTHRSSGVSGAGGTRELVFKVAKQGKVTLHASYRRSWEKQKPSQANFELTVMANS